MESIHAGTTFKKRRRQISVIAYLSGAHTKPELPNKGKITGWNDRMGRRAGAFVENFRQDFRVFGTLTYPSTYPSSGKEVKAHWRAFVERLRRIGWLETGSIFWWLEFQERGAPHFHYLATEWIGKHWVANAWAEITGGNALACSRVESIRHPDKIGNYVSKYIRKAEQKEIPLGFVDIGRMWGCSGPKIYQGERFIPVVVATTKNEAPSRFRSIIDKATWRKTVRICQTETGWVIYGSEKEINGIWRYLRENIAPIDRVERTRDILRRPQLVEQLLQHLSTARLAQP